MPKKNPDPLHNEVMHFIWLNPPESHSPEARERWRRLWNERFEGDRILTVNVNTANMMTFIGASAEMGDGNFNKALEYLDTYFYHPNAIEADHVSVAFVCNMKLFCLLYLEREAEAVALGNSMLICERRSDLRTVIVIIRNPLYIYLLQREPDSVASPEFTEFVWSVAQHLRFRKRRTLPPAATFAQLSDSMTQTWPVADRELVRRNATLEAREPHGSMHTR